MTPTHQNGLPTHRYSFNKALDRTKEKYTINIEGVITFNMYNYSLTIIKLGYTIARLCYCYTQVQGKPNTRIL